MTRSGRAAAVLLALAAAAVAGCSGSGQTTGGSRTAGPGSPAVTGTVTVLAAASLTEVLRRRPAVARAQRLVMGSSLGLFGLKLLTDRSRAVA